MKNYQFALLLAGAVTFVACKKDRVCNCTITSIGTTKTTTSSSLLPIDTTVYTPFYNSNTIASTYKKVSKTTARNNCFSRSENINETTNNSLPGLFNIANNNTGIRTYDCKLK